MTRWHTALPAGLSIANNHALYNDLIATVQANARVLRSKGYRREAQAAEGQVRAIKRSYRYFNARLQRIEIETSKRAREAIEKRIIATRKRPDTRAAPQMRRHVRARPIIIPGAKRLRTGSVGILDEDEMDKVVNPLDPSAGPYWLAQEYGTSAHLGRELWGVFTTSGFGDPTPPQSRYAGVPKPPHPRFVSAGAGRGAFSDLGFSGGMGAQGGSGGGRGIIRNPLKARHFIRDGTTLAEIEWRRDMARAEAESLVSLERIMGRTPAAVPLPRRTQARRLPRRLP